MARPVSPGMALATFGSRQFSSLLLRPDVVLCESSRGTSSGPLSRRCYATDPNNYLTQKVQRWAISLKGAPYRLLRRKLPDGRERVVVLGTGWAAYSFINQIDPTKFAVTVVSPRPFFVFTPLLTAALGGVLSMRTVIEPIRNKLYWGGTHIADYLQGSATEVKLEENTVICRSPGGPAFQVPYGKLICGVGSETNTFGVPGVKENACFLKEVEDAREIRLKLLNAFERAALPTTSDAERTTLLNVVVVGGGPAGVEAAAEIWDLVKEDLLRQYPHLAKFARTNIIEMLPHLLPGFDRGIQTYTEKIFDKIGIHTFLEYRIVRADENAVYALDKQNQEHRIPYGVFVWASGVGQVPFSRKLLTTIPGQKGNRVLRVQPSLRVLGTDNVYALGDCAFVTPPALTDRAEELFERSSSTAHGAGIDFLREISEELLSQHHVQLHRSQINWKKYVGRNNLSRADFKALLESLDRAYVAPVATAQMARQAGSYLAANLNQTRGKRGGLPYTPVNRGAMSYIGGGKAVMELYRAGRSPLNIMGGWPVVSMWHGYYWLSQTSVTNRVLSIIDYVKTLCRGRDLAEQSFSSSADTARKRDRQLNAVGGNPS